MKNFKLTRLQARYAYVGQFSLENLLPGLRGVSIGSNLSSIDFSGVTTLLLPSGTTLGGASLTALGTITSSSAQALAVGLNGLTNPAFNVDASTGSQAAGLNVVGATAAGTVAVAVISSGSNASLSIDAKGSGQIAIGGSSTGLVIIGKGSAGVAIEFTTTTDLDSQSGTATAAQLLGGIYTHNSKTGAGTLTTPTGTQLSTAIPGVAVGYTFQCLYQNRGNQTVTLTAGASGITMKGTVAVATGLAALMTFVNTGSNTWLCYVVVSA
jgi:hypothetical protein